MEIERNTLIQALEAAEERYKQCAKTMREGDTKEAYARVAEQFGRQAADMRRMIEILATEDLVSIELTD